MISNKLLVFITCWVLVRGLLRNGDSFLTVENSSSRNLNLDDKVENIWPEFGSNGKDKIKVMPKYHKVHLLLCKFFICG